MPKQLPNEILLAKNFATKQIVKQRILKRTSSNDYKSFLDKNPDARRSVEQQIIKRISSAYYTKIADLSLDELLLLEELAELVWDDECLKW